MCALLGADTTEAPSHLQEGSGCLGWFSCTEGSAGGTNPTQASKLGEFCGEPLRARVLDSSRQAPPLCEPQFPAL